MSEYIVSIKITEVTADIQRAIDKLPQILPGYGARLKKDLTWELYELPPGPEPSGSDELTDAEALDILLGGAT